MPILDAVLTRALASKRFGPALNRWAAKRGPFRWLVWKRLAQGYELKFHEGEGGAFRASPAFDEQTRALFRHWGYAPDRFAGRIVVDLGAGPRLRSTYFEGARVHAIEPLAEGFRKLACCNYAGAERIHAQPAEERVPELEGRASLVMCVNVLDHVYDPMKVLRAAAALLAPDGEFLLSTDLHPPDPPGHPVGFDLQALERLCAAAGLEIADRGEGLGAVGRGYDGDHGDPAVTLKLRKSR